MFVISFMSPYSFLGYSYGLMQSFGNLVMLYFICIIDVIYFVSRVREICWAW